MKTEDMNGKPKLSKTSEITIIDLDGTEYTAEVIVIRKDNYKVVKWTLKGGE